MRAGAGAHFRVPITESVSWPELVSRGLVQQYSKVFLSDLTHEHLSSDDQTALEDLDSIVREEGEEESYNNAELCDRYRSLPLTTHKYDDHLDIAGFR